MGGNDEFIFLILECYESQFVPDLFDNDIVQGIIMIFPFDQPSISEKEIEFMQDLDTWLLSSGHWESFWSQTIRLLDGSLSFSKHHFLSRSHYFEQSKARQNALDDLFEKFNVEKVRSQK